jgi:hypothetical protein
MIVWTSNVHRSIEFGGEFITQVHMKIAIFICT